MGTISDRLLDQHREWNVQDSDWYEHVYTQFIERMAGLGIITNADQMQFSGFWSQGDGASFTGYMDTKQFVDKHPELFAEYPGVKYLAEADCGLAFRVSRISHHYSHARTCQFQSDDCSVYQQYDEDDLRHAVFETHCELFANEQATFDKEADALIEGYADELYKDLEQEYEYLTSDEQVRASLEANEIFDDEEDEDETDETDEGSVCAECDERCAVC